MVRTGGLSIPCAWQNTIQECKRYHWLVVSTILKNMKVSWDDYSYILVLLIGGFIIPTIGENKTFQTTNQQPAI